MTDLLEKAKAARRGEKTNYDVLAPVAAVLRAKGWSYRKVHEWLQNEGAVVHPNYVTFASSICKRLKHAMKNQ